MSQKMSSNQKQANLVDLITKTPGKCKILAKAAAFPYNYKVVNLGGINKPVLLQVAKNRTVFIVDPDTIAANLFVFLSKLPKAASTYEMSHAACKTVVSIWQYSHADFNEIPKPVCFKSDPDLAFTRLLFDPTDDVDVINVDEMAPTFAKMMSRISNADALCARIGSIFDYSADRKQAVWMSGERDCGKSIMNWLIAKISGDNHAIVNNAELKTLYWKAMLVGKRVALVNEAAPVFIRSDEFKSITGDKQHAINQKNEKIYITELPVLMFFASNKPPEIQSDQAIIERVIDCRFDVVPPEEMVSEAELHKNLLAELPNIVSYCVGIYKDIPAGGRIPCQKVDLENTIDSFESDYLDFLNHHFVIEAGAKLTRLEFRKYLDDNGHRDTRKQKIFKDILLRRWNIREKRAENRNSTIDNRSQVWIYDGIRLAEDDEKVVVLFPEKSDTY